MPTSLIDVKDLPAQFAGILEQARRGAEIVVTENGIPRARLLPIGEPKERVLGLHEGACKVADDFDDPLPDEFWLGES